MRTDLYIIPLIAFPVPQFDSAHLPPPHTGKGEWMSCDGRWSYLRLFGDAAARRGWGGINWTRISGVVLLHPLSLLAVPLPGHLETSGVFRCFNVFDSMCEEFLK
ncbi:hypothetical protein CEXT_78501 [Caerostris extrusa]|uniref:Uncharacterized protein n=1 Tax=Caerostris extrusa TaxID=172846 RepID=A0AAV4Y894_CAEEX|nr:hypothetical protein CEXT_78501 [Caerostris extrusa]